MKRKKSYLRAAVKDLLIPYIESRGFQSDKRGAYQPDTYAHLFKRFCRPAGTSLQLLNIQHEKYGRPKFVLNFGSVPPDGVMYYGYHYPQDKTSLAALPVWARLCERRIWGLRWFGYPLIKIPWLRNPSPEDIVQRAIAAFPQVEAWLVDGTKGPNVGVVKLKYKPLL